jgi:ParB-like chromosome segregation protein Spo0J
MVSKKRPAKEIIELPVTGLKPHPLQARIYTPRSDWQIEELAESMKKGLDDPVEVLSDLSTVVRGNGRVEAAKRLGWEKITCWVRRDLEDAGPEAVETRLVEDNLARRHLSRLDVVRSIRHLKQIARNKWGVRADAYKIKGDLRDLVARRYGLSGRTLDRYLQVLDLPLPLQQAVDQGTLPVTLATRVVALGPAEQRRIAERVQAGADPRKVVRELLPQKAARHVKAADAVVAFHRNLERGLDDLDGRLEELSPRALEPYQPGLRRAKEVITRLLARARRARRNPQ